MSFIPDIRHRTKKLFPYADPNETNDYWQGFLNDNGVDILFGFDVAVREVLTLIENLNDEADELDIKIQPKSLATIKEYFEDHLEIQRDGLGSSLLDEMDRSEYEAIRKEVESGKRVNYCTEMEDENE